LFVFFKFQSISMISYANSRSSEVVHVYVVDTCVS